LGPVCCKGQMQSFNSYLGWHITSHHNKQMEEEKILLQEHIEIETPKGIRIRLGSSIRDVNELCSLAVEMINFVSNDKKKKVNGSYID